MYGYNIIFEVLKATLCLLIAYFGKDLVASFCFLDIYKRFLTGDSKVLVLKLNLQNKKVNTFK